MPRATPTDRVPKLLDAAASAFVEHGFQRALMDDVAERLGVSKGTIYRTVSSKEALFAAVLLWADRPEQAVRTDGLALPATFGELADGITADLATAMTGLELAAVVAERRRLRSRAAIDGEIERLATGLYGEMHARRIAIMVLDRCAAEVPELAATWFGDGRYVVVDLWAEYLAFRSSALSNTVDTAVLARTIVELITLWAVKMPWDRAPRPYPPDVSSACATMIRQLVTGGMQ